MKYAAKLKFRADESFDTGTHIDALAARQARGAGSARR
jgi:ribosome-binding factor A